MLQCRQVRCGSSLEMSLDAPTMLLNFVNKPISEKEGQEQVSERFQDTSTTWTSDIWTSVNSLGLI